MRIKQENQLTLPEALELIVSDGVKFYNLRCTLMVGRAKLPCDFDDYCDDFASENLRQPTLSEELELIKKFVAEIENYGSFFLTLEYADEAKPKKRFQLVDELNFEPL